MLSIFCMVVCAAILVNKDRIKDSMVDRVESITNEPKAHAITMKIVDALDNTPTDKQWNALEKAYEEARAYSSQCREQIGYNEDKKVTSLLDRLKK